MNDIFVKPVPSRDVKSLSTSTLVDEIGLYKSVIADAEKQVKDMVAELLTRPRKDSYIDGALYTATVVGEGITWSLDSERIKEQMGINWYNKFSKHSVRKAYIKITARKEH